MQVERTPSLPLCPPLLTLSASCTSQICSPVAGLHTGKTLPLSEFCHSLLIKTWKAKGSCCVKGCVQRASQGLLGQRKKPG